jgi:hypothetical protein
METEARKCVSRSRHIGASSETIKKNKKSLQPTMTVDRRSFLSELASPSAPPAGRDWLSRAPAWFSVVPVQADRGQEVTDELDLGERAAIALAGTIHADLLLIDDGWDGPRQSGATCV